ncbi:MAG: hypothetical protein WC822_02285 [Candidatus Paceibacterota bacterium]|jgi:hypothetical protein
MPEENKSEQPQSGQEPQKQEPAKQEPDYRKMYEEQQKNLQEMKEAMERTNSLLEQQRQQPAPQASRDPYEPALDFASTYNIPQEAAKALIKESVRVGMSLMQEQQMRDAARVSELRRIHDNFYSKNSDLAEHKAIVAAFADEVQKENPSVSMDEGFKEAAKRAREYVKSMQAKLSSTIPTPPDILPGGGAQDGAGQDGGNAPSMTPDAELDADIKMRRDLKAKAFNR